MSQRSFVSRTARPALILGVSAAILSLGLSACSVSTSGTRKPSNGSRTPAASATSDDEFDEESDEICGLIFEHYVGKPVADSTLDYDWILPSSQTWAKGDHTVQCYVLTKDGSKLTGSARNSNM